MKTLKTFAISVALAMLAGPVLAQTKAGNWELSLSGFYSYSSISAPATEKVSNMLNLYSGTASVGYFISDPLELRTSVSVYGFDGAIGLERVGEESARGLLLPVSLGADYHFNTRGKTVPYVGLDAGIFLLGAGAAGYSALVGGVLGDAHVGLKQFVSERTAIDFRVGYQYVPLPYSASLNTLMASIGICFEF